MDKEMSERTRERLLALADFIANMEKRDFGFNMSEWVSGIPHFDEQEKEPNICGSVGCIAGNALFMGIQRREMPPTVLRDLNTYNASCSRLAREYLGITEQEARILFLPDCIPGLGHIELSKVTSDHAVSVLRAFANGRSLPSAWMDVYPAYIANEEDDDDEEEDE